eukprot:IDg23667t1
MSKNVEAMHPCRETFDLWQQLHDHRGNAEMVSIVPMQTTLYFETLAMNCCSIDENLLAVEHDCKIP